VQTSSKKFRKRFEAATSARKTIMQDAIRRSGARHVELSTDRDWMLDIVGFVTKSGKTGPR
jgi:hypothetical protein